MAIKEMLPSLLLSTTKRRLGKCRGSCDKDEDEAVGRTREKEEDDVGHNSNNYQNVQPLCKIDGGGSSAAPPKKHDAK
jgi:hypothetical protein